MSLPKEIIDDVLKYTTIEQALSISYSASCLLFDPKMLYDDDWIYDNLSNVENIQMIREVVKYRRNHKNENKREIIYWFNQVIKAIAKTGNIKYIDSVVNMIEQDLEYILRNNPEEKINAAKNAYYSNVLKWIIPSGNIEAIHYYYSKYAAAKSEVHPNISLTMALRLNNLEIVKYFYDPEFEYESGLSNIAITYCDLEILKLVVGSGENFGKNFPFQKDCIFKAIKLNKVEIAKWLYDNYSKLTIGCASGCCPHGNSTEIHEIMIDPEELSSINNEEELKEILFKKMKALQSFDKKDFIEENIKPIIKCAIENSDVALLRFLHDRTPDEIIDLSVEDKALIPKVIRLMIAGAAQNNKLDNMRFLLELYESKMKKLNKNEKIKNLKKELDLSTLLNRAYPNIEIIQFIYDNCPIENFEFGDAQQAIQNAIDKCDLEVIKFLFEKHPDLFTLDATDAKFKFYSIQKICEQGRMDILEYLMPIVVKYNITDDKILSKWSLDLIQSIKNSISNCYLDVLKILVEKLFPRPCDNKLPNIIVTRVLEGAITLNKYPIIDWVFRDLFNQLELSDRNDILSEGIIEAAIAANNICLLKKLHGLGFRPKFENKFRCFAFAVENNSIKTLEFALDNYYEKYCFSIKAGGDKIDKTAHVATLFMKSISSGKLAIARLLLKFVETHDIGIATYIHLWEDVLFTVIERDYVYMLDFMRKLNDNKHVFLISLAGSEGTTEADRRNASEETQICDCYTLICRDRIKHCFENNLFQSLDMVIYVSD